MESWCDWWLVEKYAAMAVAMHETRGSGHFFMGRSDPLNRALDSRDLQNPARGLQLTYLSTSRLAAWPLVWSKKGRIFLLISEAPHEALLFLLLTSHMRMAVLV
jgi:hypothetical protein